MKKRVKQLMFMLSDNGIAPENDQFLLRRDGTQLLKERNLSEYDNEANTTIIVYLRNSFNNLSLNTIMPENRKGTKQKLYQKKKKGKTNNLKFLFYKRDKCE